MSMSEISSDSTSVLLSIVSQLMQDSWSSEKDLIHDILSTWLWTSQRHQVTTKHLFLNKDYDNNSLS